MPSPVGHALGGLAAGWLVAGVEPRAPGSRQAAPWTSRPVLHRAALFAALALAPDLDLLVAAHSTYTHSVGAVLMVALVTLVATRVRRPALAAACAAAWGSHILLDWLGADSSLPLGIMALWPFSDAFYQSPVVIFMAISRRYWRPDFVAHNTLAVLRELSILGPVVWLVWWTKRSGQLPRSNLQPPH